MALLGFRWRSICATPEEAAQAMPGDALIPVPGGSLTHAVTIRRPPEDVWPWLAQMGAGSRAGWYSYDGLDNGGRPSATRVLPELQSLTPGMVFPALPGMTDGFVLQSFEPHRSLVLGWPAPGGGCMASTWAFLLRPIAEGTRLVVRARGGPDYQFKRLPPSISRQAIRVVHFVMQRKQLAGIVIRAEQADPLLDRFMPAYEVVDRHAIDVHAPAAAALAAACQLELFRLPLVHAVFRLRELMLRATPNQWQQTRGLIEEARAMGWVLLAATPDREVVMGAATKPWEADVRFRSVPPELFAAFDEPGYVKIAWTLRADPAGTGSVFRTETRAVATDAVARARFRRYWLFLSPGIRLIRRLAAGPIKAAAERAQAVQPGGVAV
jgi:hypothetical protein